GAERASDDAVLAACDAATARSADDQRPCHRNGDGSHHARAEHPAARARRANPDRAGSLGPPQQANSRDQARRAAPRRGRQGLDGSASSVRIRVRQHPHVGTARAAGRGDGDAVRPGGRGGARSAIVRERSARAMPTSRTRCPAPWVTVFEKSRDFTTLHWLLPLTRAHRVPERSPEDVLSFWFGGPGANESDLVACLHRWFQGGAEMVGEVVSLFGPTIEAALRHELDGWAATARGRLALVLLLDQMTRNLYRNDPRAYAGDAYAQALSVEAFDLGVDRELGFLERCFLVIPMMHAEDLALQERVVRIATELAAGAPPEYRVASA